MVINNLDSFLVHKTGDLVPYLTSTFGYISFEAVLERFRAHVSSALWIQTLSDTEPILTSILFRIALLI